MAIYEESEKIEFKRELTNDIEKEIIAFLNTNGGTIYIGIDDNGDTVGVSDENRNLYDQKIASILNDSIKPSCRNLISFYFNEKNVLVINIKEGDKKPYFISSKGPKPSGVYIRVGRNKQQATDNEILFMIMDSMNFSFEKSVCELQDLNFSYIKDLAKKSEIEFSENDFLALGIKNKEKKFTNLGLLLSDENPFFVKFASYDNKLNFKIKKVFKGSIIKISDQVLEYANIMNNTSAVIVPYQGQRIETTSYPGVSLREAILNAICHADYLRPSNIKIEFFIDRVEITNPGGILDGTLEQILNGYQTFRNPGLVRVLDKFNYIENFGKGLKRIQDAYSSVLMSPSFDVNNTYFKIILPDLNYTQNSTINSTVSSTQNSTVKLSNTQTDIINLIQSNKHITLNEISIKLNKSLSTIKKAVKKIQDLNLVRRVGSDKNGYWEVIKEKNNI